MPFHTPFLSQNWTMGDENTLPPPLRRLPGCQHLRFPLLPPHPQHLHEEGYSLWLGTDPTTYRQPCTLDYQPRNEKNSNDFFYLKKKKAIALRKKV